MQGGNNMFTNLGGQNCSQELLAKIADIVNAPVFVIKNGGFGLYDQKIVYANKAFCEATGYSESEVIGRSPEFVYSAHNGGESILDFYKNCHLGQHFTSKFKSFKKDSTEQNVTAEVTPVVGSQEGEISYIVFLSEVKEVVAASQTVQDTDDMEIPVAPIVTAQAAPVQQTPVIEVKTKPIPTVQESVVEVEIKPTPIPQAPIVEVAEEPVQTPEQEGYNSVLEEIQAELRGERASTLSKEIDEQEDDDPFGLDDYDFGEDDEDDLKEEYKLEPEEEEKPQVEVAEQVATANTDAQFFSKLEQILEPQSEEQVEATQEEVAEEKTELPIRQEDHVVAGTPEAEPYQSSQIAELIKKLEQKKTLAVQEDQIQQIKADSEHPEVLEQDLDYYAKARFLSNMSHDLRTPLNAIIGFSEVIRDQLFGPIDNQRYISYANDIFKSGQELLATVSEILELSEIEQEESPLEEEQFSLTGTIDEVLDLLSARAFQTDVKLMKKLKADNIVCNGDRRKVKQAIAGVINNAIKSSPSGGTLELSSEINGDGNFQMMVYIRSANMMAAKSNLGSLLGTVTSKIESEYPEILLAHKFIEAHGGEFSIFNSATSGTEISITIPAARLSRDTSGQEYLKVIS